MKFEIKINSNIAEPFFNVLSAKIDNLRSKNFKFKETYERLCWLISKLGIVLYMLEKELVKKFEKVNNFWLDNTFIIINLRMRKLNSVFNRQNQYDRKEFIKKYNASKKIVHKRLVIIHQNIQNYFILKKCIKIFKFWRNIKLWISLLGDFINFADISDKDLKFLKDKKDKEDILFYAQIKIQIYNF